MLIGGQCYKDGIYKLYYYGMSDWIAVNHWNGDGKREKIEGYRGIRKI